MKAKIRIALAVDQNGEWNTYGWSNGTDEEMMGNAIDCIGQNEARYWIECEVDIPEVKTIQGVVTNEPQRAMPATLGQINAQVRQAENELKEKSNEPS